MLLLIHIVVSYMPHTQRSTYPDLETFFNESGHDQNWLAAQLNRSQAWVSRVKTGLTEPSLNDALLIVRLTGVPIETLAVHPSKVSVSESSTS